MATASILEQLREYLEEHGTSLRMLASDLGVTQPLLTMLFKGRRRLTPDLERRISKYLRPKPSVDLARSVNQFIAHPAHKSEETKRTLRERLLPFVDYLATQGVTSPLDITREHVEAYLGDIGSGRKGKRLSEASLFGFTKDVRAYINFVGNTFAPEDWRNPLSKLALHHPKVSIHPLSQAQVLSLLDLAEVHSPSDMLKARNKALLYILLDGALRISELLTATKYQLGEDGILRVMGKGQREREIALSAKTLQALAGFMALRTDASPMLMVTEEGAPLTYEGVKSLFHRWRKAAPEAFIGVRLSAHTLRHTSATMRRIAGMSEGDLQTFLGHSSPVMTRHYSAFALSRTANAAALRTSPVDSLAHLS